MTAAQTADLSFAGALWDMDGTLVDTEPYWIEAEIALMSAHGLPWDAEKGKLMVGNTLLRSAEILREHGLGLPAPEIVEILLDGVVASVRREVPFRPGAAELLEQMRLAGIPCALVTMSYRRLAEAVVAACPPGSFAALITGDEVPAGKPDPAPYRIGAESLGLAPADCVAFEDSLPGVVSALGAGAQTVGIPHYIPLAGREEADGAVLIDSLSGHTPESISSALRSGLRSR